MGLLEMLEIILKQLDNYMKYNKMEGSLIHDTFKMAFTTGDFHNIYLDSKTYPILKAQMWNLMAEYQRKFPDKYIKPIFW